MQHWYFRVSFIKLNAWICSFTVLKYFSKILLPRTCWLYLSAGYGYIFVAFSFPPREGSVVDCHNENILITFLHILKQQIFPHYEIILSWLYNIFQANPFRTNFNNIYAIFMISFVHLSVVSGTTIVIAVCHYVVQRCCKLFRLFLGIHSTECFTLCHISKIL